MFRVPGILNWRYLMKCSEHTKDVHHIVSRILEEGETEAYEHQVSAHIYSIAKKGQEREEAIRRWSLF